MVNRWMTAEDKRIFEIFEIARALPGTFAKIMIVMIDCMIGTSLDATHHQ